MSFLEGEVFCIHNRPALLLPPGLLPRRPRLRPFRLHSLLLWYPRIPYPCSPLSFRHCSRQRIQCLPPRNAPWPQAQIVRPRCSRRDAFLGFPTVSASIPPARVASRWRYGIVPPYQSSGFQRRDHCCCSAFLCRTRQKRTMASCHFFSWKGQRNSHFCHYHYSWFHSYHEIVNWAVFLSYWNIYRFFRGTYRRPRGAFALDLPHCRQSRTFPHWRRRKRFHTC
mmetsp:Transcript_34410/g.58356  ORF Transcript_34410/g.58356 Transcript_34410/m.58356 type:complete len:224 (-) Transcript_34410:442-1113(-)